MSRYSQLYIERGRPEADSERARIRLRAILMSIVPDNLWYPIRSNLEREIGVRISRIGDEAHKVSMIILESSIRDLLDSVTEIAKVLKGPNHQPGAASSWLSEASRIFKEENLAYRVGEDGIVHPFVDEEFEINRASALAALGDPRFGEARQDFEAAYRHLRDGTGKEALRMMFPAVEVAAKVLIPGRFASLGANEVDRYLRPILD